MHCCPNQTFGGDMALVAPAAAPSMVRSHCAACDLQHISRPVFFFGGGEQVYNVYSELDRSNYTIFGEDVGFSQVCFSFQTCCFI